MIDSHCHLDQLSAEELRAYVECQEQAGVVGQLLAGVDPDSWKKQKELCATYKNMRRAAGIHSWAIAVQSDASLEAWFKQLEEELPDCIALGEVGLDFLKATPKERQLEVARRQLDLAVRFKKPIIGHVVKAHNEFLDLLKSYPGLTGIIHAFSSSPEVAQRYTERGFLLGLGHILIHPKRDPLIKNVSLQHVVFESDAPLDFVHEEDPRTPTALRVLHHFALVRGIDPDELADTTTQNVRRVLHWPPS